MFLGLTVEFWKYVRHVTCPLCSILLRFTWRTWTLSQYWPQTCYRCLCLVVWTEACISSPSSHGLDYLTIPGVYITSLSLFLFWLLCLATLVDVEHVFSQGQLLLSHVRSRLSVQSTCALGSGAISGMWRTVTSRQLWSCPRSQLTRRKKS